MLLRGLVLTLAVLALPDEAGAQGSLMQGVAIASLVAVLRGNGTPSAKSNAVLALAKMSLDEASRDAIVQALARGAGCVGRRRAGVAVTATPHARVEAVHAHPRPLWTHAQAGAIAPLVQQMREGSAAARGYAAGAAANLALAPAPRAALLGAGAAAALAPLLAAESGLSPV